MDFTVNMMDANRVAHVPANMAANVGTYHAHQNGHHQTTHSLELATNQQQQQTTVVSAVHHQPQQQQQHHQTETTTNMKDDCEDAFTPPPRVASVGSHQDNRVEKSTDTMDFEAPIKMEIRGHVPGVAMPEKDKNEVFQLQFNTVGEVLRYFNQVGHMDALNFMTNPDLARNINPELLRNHFLCVQNPSQSEAGRATAGAFAPNQPQPTISQPVTSPTLVHTAPTMVGGKPIKQENRPDIPPGTIIHRNVHLQPQPNQFVCWVCDMDLLKSLPFEEHMAESHNIEKPYKCERCDFYFKRKAHLDRHRRIHLPTRPYQCGVCGKGFTRNEHVRRHAFTHSGERPWKCGTCSKSFFRQEHLKKHAASHLRGTSGENSTASTVHGHPPGEYELMYSVPESPPDALQSMSALLTNEVSMQIGSGLLQIPQLSNQSTLNQLSINMSKQQSQSDIEGLGSSFLLQTTATDSNGRVVALSHQPSGSSSMPSSSALTNTNHIYSMGTASTSQGQTVKQTSSQEAGRPYQCGVCGKAFIRNEHLRRHVLTHSGQKPFTCEECSKSFSRKEHLTKHMKSHVKNTGAGHHPSSSTASQVATLHVPNGHGSLISQPGSAQAVASSILNNVSSVQSQPVVAHGGSVAHSIAASHPSAVTPHLPPGTYLPMFGLLAEVV